MSAISRGQLEAVKLLIEYSCNMKVSDKHGLGPIGMAIYYGHVSIVQYLLDATSAEVNPRAKANLLHLCAQYNRQEIAKLLISKGAKVNDKNDKGRMPIHIAVKHGSVEVLQLLLENNANVNARHTDGVTPLLISVLKGSAWSIPEFLGFGSQF